VLLEVSTILDVSLTDVLGMSGHTLEVLRVYLLGKISCLLGPLDLDDLVALMPLAQWPEDTLGHDFEVRLPGQVFNPPLVMTRLYEPLVVNYKSVVTTLLPLVPELLLYDIECVICL